MTTARSWICQPWPLHQTTLPTTPCVTSRSWICEPWPFLHNFLNPGSEGNQPSLSLETDQQNSPGERLTAGKRSEGKKPKNLKKVNHKRYTSPLTTRNLRNLENYGNLPNLGNAISATWNLRKTSRIENRNQFRNRPWGPGTCRNPSKRGTGSRNPSPRARRNL